jgi:uncharacterized protein (TIGR03067 family)
MRLLAMHALVLLLLSPVVAAPAPEDDSSKELAKLQGVWKVTASESRGKQTGAAPLADRYTLVIAGDGYAFNTYAGTLKLDPAKHTADLAVTDGRYKGVTVLGLYELKGDTLRLAMASPASRAAAERPAELKTGADTAYTAFTFERDAKVTKEEVAAKLKERKDALASQPGPGGFGRGAPSTQMMLQQIIDRLDRIEKRLDALEKKAAPPDKK